jgi:hypothetical protein
MRKRTRKIVTNPELQTSKIKSHQIQAKDKNDGDVSTRKWKLFSLFRSHSQNVEGRKIPHSSGKKIEKSIVRPWTGAEPIDFI